MGEVYELRNEVTSLKSIINNLISNRTETDNQIITGKENSLLRSRIQNKHDTIQNLVK